MNSVGMFPSRAFFKNFSKLNFRKSGKESLHQSQWIINSLYFNARQIYLMFLQKSGLDPSTEDVLFLILIILCDLPSTLHLCNLSLKKKKTLFFKPFGGFQSQENEINPAFLTLNTIENHIKNGVFKYSLTSQIQLDHLIVLTQQYFLLSIIKKRTSQLHKNFARN